MAKVYSEITEPLREWASRQHMFFVATAPLAADEARRAVVVVDVRRVSDSCGYGVPRMAFEGLREHHALSSAKKLRVLGPEGYESAKRAGSARSLEGLPALP